MAESLAATELSPATEADQPISDEEIAGVKELTEKGLVSLKESVEEARQISAEATQAALGANRTMATPVVTIETPTLDDDLTEAAKLGHSPTELLLIQILRELRANPKRENG